MKRSEGFTLIELLISLTILVMVITTVFASYRIALKTYGKIEAASDYNRNSRAAWQALSRDLRCSFMSGTNKTITFKGEHLQGNGGSSDRIDFVTCAPEIERGSGGLRSVSYYLSVSGGDSGLVRENRGFPGLPADGVPGKRQLLAPLVRSFRLRYFDGSRWTEQWGVDSRGSATAQENSLPLAVEIQVLFAGSPGQPGGEIITIAPVMSN